MPEGIVLSAVDVHLTYHTASAEVSVLRGVNVAIEAATTVAIIGASGSGKSSLLHILAAIEKPTAGHVLIDGTDPFQISAGARTALRAKTIGLVYQEPRLLRELTAEENVAAPLRIAGLGGRAARERARTMLALMGLSERFTHRPHAMSGGERQRTATARAMAGHPKILLMDEPTGSLDRVSGDAVVKLTLEACQERGIATALATHDLRLASAMTRCLELEAGQLQPAILTA